MFNPLNAQLNPVCHLLALLGAHHILHVSRIGIKAKKFNASCVCFCFINIRTISHYFPIQHCLVGFYNREVFTARYELGFGKQFSSIFIFKWLTMQIVF